MPHNISLISFGYEITIVLTTRVRTTCVRHTMITHFIITIIYIGHKRT